MILMKMYEFLAVNCNKLKNAYSKINYIYGIQNIRRTAQLIESCMDKTRVLYSRVLSIYTDITCKVYRKF